MNAAADLVAQLTARGVAVAGVVEAGAELCWSVQITPMVCVAVGAGAWSVLRDLPGRRRRVYPVRADVDDLVADIAAALRRPGQPRKLVGKQHRVPVDAASFALAAQFGGGNSSEGVRVALRFLRDALAAGRAGAEQGEGGG